MPALTTPEAKPIPVRVGTQWTNSAGRSYVVTEVLPFGRCKIRRIGRLVFGEMYTRDIRRALTASAAS